MSGRRIWTLAEIGEALPSLLEYQPDTGLLFWLPRSVEMFAAAKKPPHQMAAWNAKFAGQEAFTCFDSDGYKTGSIGNRRLRAHRVIWFLLTGEWPEIVDHINGIRSDNRAMNLRDVQHFGNMQNCVSHRAGTAPGVALRPSGKFRATVTIDGVKHHVGTFENEVDASQARADFVADQSSRRAAGPPACRPFSLYDFAPFHGGHNG